MLKKYRWSEGGLYYGIHAGYPNRLCIPRGMARNELMRNAHDSIGSGHTGANRMCVLLRSHYYWPRMSNTCESYVHKCKSCQLAKASTLKRPGMAMPLDVPNARWSRITMDFVSGLPVTPGNNDCILVVVDRLTKRAHFLPMSVKDDVDMIAQLLMDRVFSQHGIPESIFSDRDIRFVNRFWAFIMKSFGIVLHMSVAANPATDGQTERVNKIVEEMLRHYVGSQRAPWDWALSAVEFAYNNAYQASIDTTPFYADLGYHPRFLGMLNVSNRFTLDDQMYIAGFFVEQQDKIFGDIQDFMSRSQDRMGIEMNRHRRPLTFKVGDLVLVNANAYFGKAAKTKLEYLYHGPLMVQEVINPNAYRLRMPLGLRKHNTFNIKSLKPYHSRFPIWGRVPPQDREGILAGLQHITSIISVDHDKQLAEVTWQDCDISDTVIIPLEYIERLPETRRDWLKARYANTFGQHDKEILIEDD